MGATVRNAERDKKIFVLYDKGETFSQIAAQLRTEYPLLTREAVAGALSRAGKKDRGGTAFIDLTGRKFGTWTVIKVSDQRRFNKLIYWAFRFLVLTRLLRHAILTA